MLYVVVLEKLISIDNVAFPHAKLITSTLKPTLKPLKIKLTVPMSYYLYVLT